MNIRSVYLLSFVLVCDCETVLFEPEEVATGIYAITVRTTLDTCQPPRGQGGSFAAAFQLGDQLAAFDYDNSLPDAPISMQYELDAANGYQVRWPKPGGRLDPCPAPSAESSYVREYRLIGAARNRFEVEEDETWTLGSDCGEILSPTASCHATRELSYELMESCAAPCTIRTDGPEDRYNGLTCSCSAPAH